MILLKSWCSWNLEKNFRKGNCDAAIFEISDRSLVSTLNLILGIFARGGICGFTSAVASAGAGGGGGAWPPKKFCQVAKVFFFVVIQLF